MRQARFAQQRGMSGGGWFVVIVLIFSAASISLRLVPHYMSHGIVDGQIRSLLNDPDIAAVPRNQLHERLESRLKLNNIRDFEIRDKLKLKIKQRDGVIEMDLFYEVREPVFGNVDLLLTFEEHYEKVL